MTKLKEILCRSIENAGPRYTPGIDHNAPNLEITFLIESIDYLVRGKRTSNLFNKILYEMNKNFLSDKKMLGRYIRSKDKNISSIISCIENYLSLKPSEIFDDLKLLRNSVNYVYRKLEDKRANLWQKKDQAEGGRVNEISNELYVLNRWISIVSDLDKVTNSKYFELSNKPYLLLGGEAGTGKTHLLCDLSIKKINEKNPVLMVLAQELTNVTDPFSQLAEKTGFAKNKIQLLKKLSALSDKRNERALIIIDGINEGDYKGWKSGFSSMINDLAAYPQIGLIISARTPYDYIFCDKEYNNKIISLYHRGFDDIEFDAVTQFFHYYNIPMPDYPLLDSEFSNPLFLKVACEALREIGEQSQKRRRLNEIASGLKTITTLFEDYVTHCAKSIEEKYNLPRKICWNIIKGKKVKIDGVPTEIGIATIMAKEGREWIYPHELKEVIQKHTALSGLRLDEFYAEFPLLGIVISEIRWLKEKQQVFRLPYQRISDHIIARSLLRNHLSNIKNESELKERLQNTRLGQVFKVNNPEWGQYDKPELAAAIIMEFPEFVKNKKFISEDNREIIIFLPEKNQSLNAFYQPFLSGLTWRHNTNFSACTNDYVSYFLACSSLSARKKALEATSNLATRKDHIYNGQRLYSYLSKFSVADRDLFWSEFIRNFETYSIRERLIKWLSSNDLTTLDENSVDNFLYILKLFLCSSDERLRDRSTKLIFDLGLLFPHLIFRHALEGLDFNDPYLSERVLAASYGVAMRLYAKRKNLKNIANFAKDIYHLMFDVKAKHSTTHFIIRDYASSLIQLAKHIDPSSFDDTQLKRTVFPFHKMGITRWLLAEPQDGAMPMSYDFRKDNVSRLANNHDKYNFEHPNHSIIERKILWRIKKFGFSLEKFKNIDSYISQMQHMQSSGHIKTYGEKYSLIAYYELLGFLYDRGKVSLNHLSGNNRIELSIDPSFPIYKSHKNFVSFKLLRKSKNIGKWVKKGGIPNFSPYLVKKEIKGIKNNAILLNGIFFEKNKEIGKQLFIHIRGVFVNKNLRSMLVEGLKKTPLERLNIPEVNSYRYIYSGEIPWSDNFYLLDAENLTATEYLIKDQPDGSKSHSFLTLMDVPVEIPYSEYSWNTQSCLENKIGSVSILSKNMIDHFGLFFNPDGMNFYDKIGEQVSSIIKFVESDCFHNHYEFFYISEKILQDYLNAKNLSLIWIVTGEKAIYFEDDRAVRESKEECFWKPFKYINFY